MLQLRIGVSLDLAVKPGPVDISGIYEWSETAKGLIPEELAESLFGIEPEGKATHFTCEDHGILTIDQDGTSFEGEGTQVGTCITRGGQEIVNDFDFAILNGRITGRSIHFDFGDPVCPYMGVLEVVNGVVVGIRGTGRCGPFGPRDNFKATTWQATRAE